MLTLLVLSAVLQVLYWWYAYLSSPKDVQEVVSGPQPGVSIIIAARNEARRLPSLLDSLATQYYPTYEVVIADDCSTDDTYGIATSYQDRLDIKVLQIKEDHPGKKHALASAIAASKFDYLLLTDADCTTKSDLWILSMVSSAQDSDVVIGYSPLRSAGTIASSLAAAEATWTGAHYLAAAKAGRPYMAVGRNMLLRRSAYDRVGGYSRHSSIASGDDDLLVQDVKRTGKITAITEKKSWVTSDAATTWSQWIRQKARHLSTATTYSTVDQIRLGAFALLHIGTIVLAIACLFINIRFCVLVLTIKWSLQILIVYRWYRALGAVQQLWFYPIIEIALAIFYTGMAPYLYLRRSASW